MSEGSGIKNGSREQEKIGSDKSIRQRLREIKIKENKQNKLVKGIKKTKE